MSKLNDREHAELLMLYKNAIDDIDRAKRQQWTQFYAILLAQAAVAGFSRLPSLPPDLKRAEVIWWSIAVLMLLGLLVVGMNQLQLYRLRGLIEEYSKDLEEKSKELRSKKEARSLHRAITPVLMALTLMGVFCFLVKVILPG